jgi:hypothetical protein
MQDICTKTTNARSTFAKKHTLILVAAEEEIDGAVNIATNKCVEFDTCLLHAEIEVTTWSIIYMDSILCKLESVANDVT